MIFDDSFRRRLEVLKRIVARALAGRGGGGRSALKERGGRVEFAGHRAYTPGDDAATLDWHAYARLETLVVKEFEAPREGHLLLVLDRSGSMGCFGKDDAALRLGAALGWLGLATGARVAATARGGATRWCAGVERFTEILDGLERLPQGGDADLPSAVERAPRAGTGPLTAVVLSDFYEAESAARALAALQRRSAAVHGVHVLAPAEMRVPAGSAARLVDAETQATMQVELTEEIRAAFHAAAEAFAEERKALAVRHGARWSMLDPEEDLVAAVERVFVGVGKA